LDVVERGATFLAQPVYALFVRLLCRYSLRWAS